MTQSKIDLRLKGFDRFVKRCMDDWDVPGVAVGIVKGNRAIYTKGYGFLDVKTKLPVTENALFPIGSCTKAFTATAIGILIDEGKLEWDKPIRKYIPWFKMYDPIATEKMTIRDVLIHRTGMPRHIFVKRHLSVTREELIRRLRYLEPFTDFRNKHRYTSFMYAVAGFLIEHITGKTWERFIKERIFEPLGMTASTYLTDVSMNDMPVGYWKKGKKIIPGLSLFEKKIDLVTAVGGKACGPGNSIVSDVVDLCLWIRFQLNQGKVGRHQIISKQSLREIHTPQVVMPEWESKCKLLLNASRCMGWVVRGYRGYRLFLHGGAGWGHQTHVMFLPNEHIGAVVLTNIASPLEYVIPLNIFDRLLGLKQFGWSVRAKRFSREQEAQARRKKTDRERKRGTYPSRPLKDYAGDYRHPGYDQLSVCVEGNELIIKYDPLSLRFKHYHYNVFQMTKLRGDGWIPRMKATFQTDKNGMIKSIALPLVDQEPEMFVVFKRIGDTKRPKKKSRLSQ